MNITDFLAGRQILEEVDSPINGKLTVVRDLAWGTTINGGGLPQSGGVAEKVWKTALAQIVNYQLSINNVLILGLGGGSIAKLVRKNWPARAGEPDVKITGVDIDPVIVELGKKYMKLEEFDVDIKIQDARKFLTDNLKPNTYDLICVDLYIGDEFPKKFESEKFLYLIRLHLERSGVVVFNRLYFDEKRSLAKKFEKKLERIFKSTEVVYPAANVVFICSD